MQHSVELQSLVDSHERPFMVIDKSFKIIAMNKLFETSFGVKSDDAIGKHCYEVSHGNEKPCFELGEECPHQQVYDSKQVHSSLHIHCDHHNQNHRVRVTVYPLHGPNGEIYVGESIQELSEEEALDDTVSMVGSSPSFLEMTEKLILAARTDSSVLLQGETGTGKELAASFIHHNSHRLDGPFLTLDCTVLTESLFESEVFGHEHGAFTGTQGKKKGLFELAHGGTLFLDEIGELSPIMQAKLLRVLESGEFRRVGGTRTLFTDVRIICATNRNVADEVKLGRFRGDLYYRIAEFSVYLPNLNERSTDIPALADVMLKRISKSRKTPLMISDDAMTWLRQHHYNGNIRELRNILSAAAAICDNGYLCCSHLNQTQSSNQLDTPMPIGESHHHNGQFNPKINSLSKLEEQQIARLVKEHGGKRKDIAEILGISVRTLYRKMKIYGLNKI